MDDVKLGTATDRDKAPPGIKVSYYVKDAMSTVRGVIDHYVALAGTTRGSYTDKLMGRAQPNNGWQSNIYHKDMIVQGFTRGCIPDGFKIAVFGDKSIGRLRETYPDLPE